MSCKVIRIGVFFDGTGNNLANDEAGRSRNGVSNIGKLYRLYADKEVLRGNKVTECLIYTRAIYIEGVGTVNNGKDYMWGGAAGTLGAQRIRRAIRQVASIRDQFPQSEYKCYIDVFGFSRGAAMARDFINSMYRTPNSRLKVTFKFVGLFDTVGSFGLAGNNINYKPITDKDTETDTIKYELAGKTPPSKYYEPYNFNLAPKSAEKIVHFVALDEYRENFPLSDTQGVGETYYFIGAHSDIGGGYAKTEDEDLFEYSSDSINQAEKNLETPHNGIKFGKNWQYRRAKYESDYSVNAIRFPTLCTGSRNVTDDLQKITLAAMYNLAIKENVPFVKNIPPNYQDVPFTPDSAKAFSNWTKELIRYYEVATGDISSLKSVIGGQTSFNNQTVPHIRTPFHLTILAKYAHNSSASSMGDKTSLPPIGLKHRTSSGRTDTIANGARRIRNNPLPIREAYANNIRQAVVRND